MASKTHRDDRRPQGGGPAGAEAGATDPRPRSLALAVALAGAHALWALFQWTELVDARRGGDAYCAFGAGGQCASVWDSAFAGAVQGWTGLPVAGWGLVWSAVAFLFPLVVLVRQATGRAPGAAWSAALWTSLAGVGGVAVFAAASFAAGAFCSTCAGTYVLVLLYAATCLTAARRVAPALEARGVVLAAAATAVAFVLLLPPGLRTPSAAGAATQAALEAVGRTGGGVSPGAGADAAGGARDGENAGTAGSAGTEAAGAEPARDRAGGGEEAAEPEELEQAGEEQPGEGAGTGEEAPAPSAPEPAGEQQARSREDTGAAREADAAAMAGRADEERLRELLTSLPPQAKQILADELARYRRGEPPPVRPPRLLVGPSDAPLRITDFTDTLCGHCANLHEALERLREIAPGAFAVEPRQFPLDGSCNPAMPEPSPHPVRCLAAKALICVEGRPGFFEYAGALFESQRTLTEEKVYELAEPYRSRDALQQCVASDATQAKLNEDVEWALEHEIRGTPLVLVNGRKGSGFPPFVYAIVLSGGDPDHPLFSELLPDPDL